MIPPRLNQTITGFKTKTLNRDGERTVSNPFTFQGRLVEGQKKDYAFVGNEATYNGSLHTTPDVPLFEDSIIKYNGAYYSVANVVKTRGLNGQVIMIWCQLEIEASIDEL